MKWNWLVIFSIPVLSACKTLPEIPFPKSADFWEGEGIVLVEHSKSSEVAKIDKKHEFWLTNAPTHYRYVVSQSCYCLFGPSYGPNDVEVRDGKVVKVTYRGETRDGFESGDSLMEVKSAVNDTPSDIFAKLIKAID